MNARNRAIGVADEVHGGIVGEAAVGPTGNAVLGGEMVGFAVAPVVDSDVIQAVAIPEDGIFDMIETVLVHILDRRINARALGHVRAKDILVTDPDYSATPKHLETSI